MISLKKEFDFFIQNQKSLIKKYKGKYITIKDNEVLGAYDSMSQAIKKTAKNEDLGTFLVQKCDPSKEAYSQTYYSRVTFESK